MIRVPAQPEYAGFDAEVRTPGTAFLQTCPAPSSDQFRKKNFWSKAGKQLHAAYSGVCAYTATYLPHQGSIDHFLPKTTHPQLAYEWSNFRLASGRVNSCKGNQTNILDPFQIEDDWFYLIVPACLIRANPILAQPLRARINQTINSLRLNQDDHYVAERCSILIDYARGDVTLAFLNRRYPFIAKEVHRQGLGQAMLQALFKL